MERGLSVAVKAVAGLFALISLWVGFWAVVAGPGLSLHPRNPRLAQVEREILRGGIYSRDGKPLAESEGEQARRWSGAAAHLVGYSDGRFGKAGLEASYDQALLGLVEGTGFARFWRAALGQRWQGWDLITTVDFELQLAAERALGERAGAVVLLEPASGAILAMASSPSFDPNRLGEYLLSASQGSALFNRATQGQYPPGSSFKPVVLAAALESRSVRPGALFEDSGSFTVDGRAIRNAGDVAHGRLALDDALALSSNVVFARLALDMGWEPLRRVAEALGFGASFAGIGIPVAGGHLPGAGEVGAVALAEVGIGQGELLVTPLQMAVFAAAIANGGWRVHPHAGLMLRSPTGEERLIAHPRPERAISVGTAQVLREAMVAVVERGTGTGAKVAGLEVAGKTGTAENPHGRPHAWFVGFAPARSPEVALAVVVENGGAGGAVAAPIAREILEAWQARRALSTADGRQS